MEQNMDLESSTDKQEEVPLPISIMLSVKLKLERIPPHLQDNEYKIIHCQVKNYLLKKCKHNVVEDLIDITEEKSKTIYYCTYCETTFPCKTQNYYDNMLK